MFTIPEIPVLLNEHEYIKANDLLATAGSLAGDGQGNELGQNAEYERGMGEMVVRYMGWPADFLPHVIAAIHGYAKDNAGKHNA